MATIIVPAHNESAVIADCLNSIVNQQGVDQVIVACNGCTDNTVGIVRERFPNVHCLDIRKPSKVNALNEAEAKAKELGMVFPVFYIDADTTLSQDAISNIVKTLEASPILLAAPTPIIDTSKSSWLVKQYYTIWTNLPYVKEGVIATCSYIITEEGRKRFDRFPDVISDDGYVRSQFRNSEISNISGAEIHIRAPKDIYSLIKIKTRARLGIMQLLKTHQYPVREAKHYGSAITRKLLSKDLVSAAIYILIALIIRIRSSFQLRRISQYQWEKDASSRGMVA
jgi:glycosyltransferase involved in cell wall biosynthesis